MSEPQLQRATGAAADAHQAVLRLMRSGDWRGAEQACRAMNARYPDYAAGWQCASHIALRLGAAADALGHVDRALGIEPGNPGLMLQRGHCLLALGQLADAREAAAGAQRGAGGNGVLLDAIGSLCSRANDQRSALAAYEQAVATAPGNAQFIFNRAAARRFLGQFAEAEADYDRVIALNPADYEAYRNRSDLRTQTAQHNHVAELERLATHTLADWRAEVALRYALAKEYEDLGQYEQSFQHLRHGATVRRQHLRYDVANDVATVDWIIEAFAAAPTEPVPNACSEAPIFIVGLPRSGSTLVDRILGSHSQLYSAGELKCLALAIVDAVRRQNPGAQMPRRELVARSASLDFAALGSDYLDRVRRAGVDAVRFTDKMPLNYLYCGLIGRALPNARIVHVRRNPMAACYAMYKALFEDGYPFSYDLAELGQYYLGYWRLMAHWQATIPQAIYTLSYEELVADQLGQTRKLLQFCGLEWQDACAQFHHNPAPTTTASAAQVRQPIYDSSVSQWRHYEQQLAPLESQLSAAGIRTQE
ncbi:MAG TPA: sulfotransferase [Steroidobacteraceae bacterium]|jgi:tetratricopeptide (TPR) repeat protein|nr:sulfotransferase [Steroidobacteraceae bacterium]